MSTFRTGLTVVVGPRRVCSLPQKCGIITSSRLPHVAAPGSRCPAPLGIGIPTHNADAFLNYSIRQIDINEFWMIILWVLRSGTLR